MRIRSAELLKKHNIKLKKTLGQNLLLDPNINRKMADVAELGPGDSVFEVGTGIGDLTEVLASRAGNVFTIEIDRSFEPALSERFDDNPRVKLFMGDVLSHSVKDLTDLFLPNAKTLKMVSNLPFYITSPVLMHFLESESRFVSLTVMVQREVAERIVAPPGGKDYGILSIACQFYARPHIAHIVSPNCFRPRPKVHSAIVHLSVRDSVPLAGPEKLLFFRIVNAAFGQRRKKLVNALAAARLPLSADKDGLRRLLEECGIQPDCRAETVSVDSFARLAMFAARGPAQPK